MPVVQILWMRADSPLEGTTIREPHRHDYHELFVLTGGRMDHQVDGKTVSHEAGSAFLIGRGQLHVLERTVEAEGVLVRFSEEVLTDAAQQASPGWFLVRSRTCVMSPPENELQHLQALVRGLDDEIHGPNDSRSPTLEAYYLSAALLLIDRWQGSGTLDVVGSRSTEVELFQSFARLLEADFSVHHDAAWYADQLAVSANHLSSAVTELTGRSTKKLISDRVMTEAQRLLRHTNLPVQQISSRVGYEDPLYFSRAFRQRVGASPSGYRDR